MKEKEQLTPTEELEKASAEKLRESSLMVSVITDNVEEPFVNC